MISERYREIDGDLIELALEGKFDVIAHGCNCFCTMSAGIALQMAQTFGCNTFKLERLFEEELSPDGYMDSYPTTINRGDINKLGQIDYSYYSVNLKTKRKIAAYSLPKSNDIITMIVVNAYTQYYYGKNHVDGKENPLDYEALTLCMRKINHIFPGKHIGLPKIGAGLAGGDWEKIKKIIQHELIDCQVTIVNYKK